MSEELDRLREAAARFRRAATLVERTGETTLIQWPSAEVDAFIAAFPISEDGTSASVKRDASRAFRLDLARLCMEDFWLVARPPWRKWRRAYSPPERKPRFPQDRASLGDQV